MNNGSPSVLTVPLNSAVNFQIGQTIPLIQLGSGEVTVSPAVGVTINSLGGVYSFSGQYATAALTQIATNVWNLSFDSGGGSGGSGVMVGDSPTWTGNHLWQQSIPANTSAAAQRLVNPAAATSGNQRYSLATQWEGFGWDASVSASRSVRFRSFVQSVEGAVYDSPFVFQSSFNNGAWVDCFSINGNGEGGTLPGTWYAGNINVSGVLEVATINGLYGLTMFDAYGDYSVAFYFESASAPTGDRVFRLALNDADRVLGLEADWSLGTYTGTAPTATGKLTVTVAGQLYEIPARLVP